MEKSKYTTSDLNFKQPPLQKEKMTISINPQRNLVQDPTKIFVMFTVFTDDQCSFLFGMRGLRWSNKTLQN